MRLRREGRSEEREGVMFKKRKGERNACNGRTLGSRKGIHVIGGYERKLIDCNNKKCDSSSLTPSSRRCDLPYTHGDKMHIVIQSLAPREL